MIRVQSEDFDVGAEIDRVGATSGRTGGIVSFVGVVRAADKGDPQAIRALTLQHYPGMTERLLNAIEAEARRRWPLDEVLIIHRVGRLTPGERIVIVVTASAHRQAAFESCSFLMDWLKTRAPFWKAEETASGTRWVEARQDDEDAAARWQKEATTGAV
ncbi:MAG: molybdenum cofactor biosynthesis protein MoaE [Alphaproteobacteria bacterium]